MLTLYACPNPYPYPWKYFCTFAQAAGRFALLHILPHPYPCPYPYHFVFPLPCPLGRVRSCPPRNS